MICRNRQPGDGQRNATYHPTVGYTPTTAGTYNFTAKVVDSAGNSASVNCSITINPAPALALAWPGLVIIARLPAGS